MNKRKIFITFLLLTFFSVVSVNNSFAEPQSKAGKDDRCSICGMFVAKYPAWLSQIILSDGKVQLFDGVKDMMVYYFSPKSYGLKAGIEFKEIWVKDYYSLNWVEARKAFYVKGSDVYGPMGHEFIPFATKEAADTFLADHDGKKVINFSDITSEMVEKMRVGNRM